MRGIDEQGNGALVRAGPRGRDVGAAFGCFVGVVGVVGVHPDVSNAELIGEDVRGAARVDDGVRDVEGHFRAVGDESQGFRFSVDRVVSERHGPFDAAAASDVVVDAVVGRAHRVGDGGVVETEEAAAAGDHAVDRAGSLQGGASAAVLDVEIVELRGGAFQFHPGVVDCFVGRVEDRHRPARVARQCHAVGHDDGFRQRADRSRVGPEVAGHHDGVA